MSRWPRGAGPAFGDAGEPVDGAGDAPGSAGKPPGSAGEAPGGAAEAVLGPREAPVAAAPVLVGSGVVTPGCVGPRNWLHLSRSALLGLTW